MTDPYEKLREARINRTAAENALNAARAKVEEVETAFRVALPVGANVPCSVAVLPGGRVAVHVWVESASNPNQLHIVTPRHFDENAKPREKFPNEQLGAG